MSDQLGVVGDNGAIKKRGRPSGDEFDPWSTEGGNEYNPERIYTRSTNKYDHSHRAEFRLPPQIHAQVLEIVDKVPKYRSIADFWRDAAVHRMKYWYDRLDEIPYEMKMQLAREMWLCQGEQLQQEMELMETLVIKYREVLEQADRTSNTGVLGAALKLIEVELEGLEEPYQEQMRMMAKTYRQRLKQLG